MDKIESIKFARFILDEAGLKDSTLGRAKQLVERYQALFMPKGKLIIRVRAGKDLYKEDVDWNGEQPWTIYGDRGIELGWLGYDPHINELCLTVGNPATVEGNHLTDCIRLKSFPMPCPCCGQEKKEKASKLPDNLGLELVE